MEIHMWSAKWFLRLSTQVREKGRDLTQFYDKSPYTDRKIKKATWKHKTPPKTSITQRLQTDLGRSVGVTIATQLVWLNRYEIILEQFPVWNYSRTISYYWKYSLEYALCPRIFWTTHVNAYFIQIYKKKVSFLSSLLIGNDIIFWCMSGWHEYSILR